MLELEDAFFYKLDNYLPQNLPMNYIFKIKHKHALKIFCMF